MSFISRIVLAIALATPIIGSAAPVFRIRPVSTTFSCARGTTCTIEFQVVNVSGVTQTITNEQPNRTSGTFTTDSISNTSNCENSAVANNGSCILDVSVVANADGTDYLRPRVCAFNGQLCSRSQVNLPVTVVDPATINCRTNAASPACRVFATSTTYTGDMSTSSARDGKKHFDEASAECTNATGASKADCLCNVTAREDGYGNVGSWRAWLATSNFTAPARIGYNSSIVYKRASADLTIASAGALLTAATSDFTTAIGGAGVTAWTGALPAGTATATTCTNWTSASAAVNGTKGLAVARNGAWSNAPPLLTCSSGASLYCFERPSTT